MEQQTHSPKFLRQRKFLVAVPLLALPFITLLFWSLGGGQASEAQAKNEKGINTNLPDASFKEDQLLDKMSYYAQAAKDSAALNELMKNDPYYKADSSALLPGDTMLQSWDGEPSARRSGSYTNQNEAKVYQKLDRLNTALNQASSMPDPSMQESMTYPGSYENASATSEMERLERMMQGMNQSTSTDPELQQLSGMLEKILDIQHPDRVQEKLRQTSEQRRGQVFAVSAYKKEEPVSLLDNSNVLMNNFPSATQQNGFYSFDNAFNPADSQNAIQAVVHETQTLVNSATVKMRLLNDVYINGILIPKDNFIYGVAALNGERLSIKISSIRYGNSLYPVELSVFDMDGVDGIYIPGAISRDVSKESAERSIQDIGITSLDPSWQAQAAGAGLEAAKTLFSKKVKLIRVTVKAGYQLLLRDEKQKLNNQ